MRRETRTAAADKGALGDRVTGVSRSAIEALSFG